MAKESKLKLGIIGGGLNSAIGVTHKIALKMDDRFEIAARGPPDRPSSRGVLRYKKPSRFLVLYLEPLAFQNPSKRRFIRLSRRKHVASIPRAVRSAPGPSPSLDRVSRQFPASIQLCDPIPRRAGRLPPKMAAHSAR